MKQKPWEVEIEVFEDLDESDKRFWWRIECEAPEFYVVGGEKYETEQDAIVGARGIIAGPGLVERKVNP